MRFDSLENCMAERWKRMYGDTFLLAVWNWNYLLWSLHSCDYLLPPSLLTSEVSVGDVSL